MSDEEARNRRAAELRRQIAGLTGRSEPAPGADTAEPAGHRRPPRVHPLSPRDFVEQRMRELDQAKPARSEDAAD